MGIIRKKMIPSGLSRADILQNSFKDYIKFEANKIKETWKIYSTYYEIS